MVVKVNLYWQHDLDLIALNANPEFNLGKAMKAVIIAYARGERFTIPLPPPQERPVVLDSCYVHFQLNAETEFDVIKILGQFRPGHRNPALKQIFRGYLEAPYLPAYFNDETYKIKSRVNANRKTRKKPAQDDLDYKMYKPSGNAPLALPGKQQPEEKTESPRVSPAEEINTSARPAVPMIEKPTAINPVSRTRPDNTLDNASRQNTIQVQKKETDVPKTQKKEANVQTPAGAFDLFGAVNKLRS